MRILLLGTFCVVLTATSPAFSQELIDLEQVWGDIRIIGAEEYDWAGRSLAAADVNDDGLSDLIIGATSNTSGYPGKVFALFGQADFPSTIDFGVTPADLTVKAPQNQSPGMGRSVTCGDLNNDGIADLVIGSSLGEAYVIFGSNQLPTLIDLKLTPADLTILGAGYRVATGDINTDGTDDLLVGDAGASEPGRTRCGKVYVVYGRTNLPDTIDFQAETADLTVIGDKWFRGLNVAGASGDINGDGVSDLVAKGGEMVYVIFGRADLPDVIDLETTPADVTVKSEGGVVATGADDVNGDGVMDLLIGTPGDSPGRVYVTYGNENLPSYIDFTVDPADLTIIGEDEDLYINLSWSIATGDYSQDGIADIFLGAPAADPPDRQDAGKAYLIYGGESLPSVIDLADTPADITVWGEGWPHHAGSSVLISDLNGDKFNDMMIGAPGNCYTYGRVYVIYGENPFGDFPAGLKKYAVELLTEVESGERRIKKELDRAIEHAKKSLNEHPEREGVPWKKFPLWADESHLDEIHGHMVFDEEKKAARKLAELQDDPRNDLPPGFCVRVLGLLTEADSTLARTAIQDAEEAGGNKKELERAEREMKKAIRALSAGGYCMAIEHFKHAWKHGMLAIKKQEKAKENTQIASLRLPEPSKITLSLTPNPFTQKLICKLSMKEPGIVTLRVYDIRGSLVRTLVDKFRPAGTLSVVWDGRNQAGHPLASGIYLAKMTVGGCTRTEKAALIR